MYIYLFIFIISFDIHSNFKSNSFIHSFSTRERKDIQSIITGCQCCIRRWTGACQVHRSWFGLGLGYIVRLRIEYIL